MPTLRRNRGLLCITLVVLSGCASVTEPPVDEEPVETGSQEFRSFRGNLSLVVNETVIRSTGPRVPNVIAMPGTSLNCIVLHADHPYKILLSGYIGESGWENVSGTANLSWTPKTPSANRLWFGVLDWKSKQGGTPVTQPGGRVVLMSHTSNASSPGPDANGLQRGHRFIVYPIDDGVYDRQQVSVELSFEYRSESKITASVEASSSCARRD